MSKSFVFVALVYGCVILFVYGDEYVDESKDHCTARRNLLSCAKYRVLTYITNYTDNSIIVNKAGPLKLIRVDDVEDEQSLFTERPRHYSGDGEFSKFLKFIQRQINHFLNHQGIVISLPPGARFIDFSSDYKAVTDSRGKKKKADLLLQLITLFKVFKIKVLVALALAGILFIKKVLLVAAFILPSIIHNIKMHCKAAAASNAYHHFEEHHDDHPAFGGISGYGGFGHSSYGENIVKNGDGLGSIPEEVIMQMKSHSRLTKEDTEIGSLPNPFEKVVQLYLFIKNNL